VPKLRILQNKVTKGPSLWPRRHDTPYKRYTQIPNRYILYKNIYKHSSMSVASFEVGRWLTLSSVVDYPVTQLPFRGVNAVRAEMHASARIKSQDPSRINPKSISETKQVHNFRVDVSGGPFGRSGETQAGQHGIGRHAVLMRETAKSKWKKITSRYILKIYVFQT
jgi:hypothetical protein